MGLTEFLKLDLKKVIEVYIHSQYMCEIKCVKIFISNKYQESIVQRIKTEKVIKLRIVRFFYVSKSLYNYFNK